MKTNGLSALYLSLGVAGLAGGAAWLAAFVHIARHGDGPASVGVALACLVALLAHAIPAAGLPALALLQRDGKLPEVNETVLGVGVALVAVTAALLSVLALPLFVALSLGAVFAAKLGQKRRAWVLVWTITSAPVFMLDVLALTLWWSQRG